MLVYPDPYAHIYQKMEGFNIKIKAPFGEELTAYLSLNPSTRSTYDIAMRDATIDGLITMDNIELLKPSQIFYREEMPNELFILQSVNKFEFQQNTRNINAIKQNCFVTVKRKQYNDETENEEFMNVYEDIVSFITTQNKDEKNFAAGIEDNTAISIQIPKRTVEGKIYIIENQDKIFLTNLEKDLTREIKVESLDEYSVPGVIKIYGTYDIRTGE